MILSKKAHPKLWAIYNPEKDKETGLIKTDMSALVQPMPDEGVAANPVTAEELAQEKAVEAAAANTQAALKAWQDAMRQGTDSRLAFDYKKNEYVMIGAPEASDATIARLKEAYGDERKAEEKELVKLTRIQLARADRIRAWHAAQIVVTPLQMAVAEAARDKRELTPEEVRRLGGTPSAPEPELMQPITVSQRDRI